VARQKKKKQVQEGWKPIRLGEKLLVKFTWHGESDVRPLLEATPGLQLMTLEGASSSSSLLLHVNTEMARMESLTDGPMCVCVYKNPRRRGLWERGARHHHHVL